MGILKILFWDYAPARKSILKRGNAVLVIWSGWAQGIFETSANTTFVHHITCPLLT